MVGFLALGVWQVERLGWKLDLIARVEARIQAPPSPLPPPVQWPAINERDDAYRHIQAQGILLHHCETLVQALTELGGGYWVMTPLQTSGGVVFVNRGYVPYDRRDSSTRNAAQFTGPISVTGLLRLNEPGGTMLRSNDPGAGRWVSRDVEAMGASCGLSEVAPFFIDADATANPGGYPVGGLTVVDFSNNHLVYALTWFALAVLSAVGAALTLRAGRYR